MVGQETDQNHMDLRGVHVLLVSLLDRSNGQPICTLTNLFLSGQKQNGHYYLADQFFFNFFYSLSKTRVVQNPEKCQFALNTAPRSWFLVFSDPETARNVYLSFESNGLKIENIYIPATF